MAKANYKIPFDEQGNQMDYPAIWSTNIDWRDNHEFSDGLVFESSGRGRSSVTFILRRISDGKKVTMFLKDFTAMIPQMVNGVASGKFTFVKRGQNYGCQMVGK